MPQLVIAAAGAAIGGAAFGTGALALGMSGAAWGWMAGSLVGGLLFAPDGPKAQMADLRAPKLDMGSKMHRVYGTVRVPLSPRWQDAWTAHENSAGGKGGGGSEYYTYTTNVLYWVADIARMPENLRVKGWSRIWWNGELAATRLAASDQTTEGDEENRWDDVSFYDGNEDQLPWPIFEAALGAANADAHRRIACIAIENIKTGTWSNLPLLEAEVYTSGDDEELAAPVRYATNVAEARKFDTNERPFGSYALGSNGHLAVLSPDGLNTVTTYEVDLDGVETALGTDEIPAGFDQTRPGRGSGTRALMAFGRFVNEDGPVAFGAAFALVGDGVSISVALPDDGNVIGSSQIRFATFGTKVAVASAAAIGYGADEEGEFTGAQGRIYVYDVDGVLYDNIDDELVVDSIALGGSQMWALSGGTIYHYTGVGGAAFQADTFAPPSGSNLSLFCGSSGALYCANAEEAVYAWDGEEWTQIADLSGADANLGTTSCIHAATGSTLYIAQGKEIEEEAEKFSWLPSGLSQFSDIPPWPDSNGIADIASYHATLLVPSVVDGFDRPYRGMTWMISGVQVGGPNDFGTGISGLATVEFSWENFYYASPHPDGFETNTWQDVEIGFTYHRRTMGVELQPKYKHDLWRKPLSGVTPGMVDLADIVSAECLRCGLTEDDIDVAALEGIPVRGFVAQGSARQAIDDLKSIFHFDYIDAENLTFFLLDADPVVSIPNADTGAGVGRPTDAFAGLERGNDLEVPSEITLVSPNPSADYDPGAETADRLVTSGNKKETVQSMVVLSPAERKGRANAFALDARIAMHTARVTVNDDYAATEPGDVGVFYDEDGNGYTCRITRETYADGIHDLEIRLFDRTALTREGVTSDTYRPVIDVARPEETNLVLIDTGLLRDTDDGLHLIAAVAPAGDGRWTQASIFRSVDDAAFSSVASTGAAAIIGSAAAPLGDFAGWTWDEANTVTVDVGGQTLVSSSRSAMQSDAAINVAAIGVDGRWEVIRYRTATLVSAGVYRLSGLLRGLYGTESFRGTHQPGDTFVKLSASTLTRLSVSASELGLTRYWKGVTAGQPVSAVPSQSLSPDGVAMKPWAPTRLRIARDGSDNATLTWSGRSRLSVRYGGPGGTLVQPDATQIGWRVRILDGSTVVRTVDVTDAEMEYSAAEQTADGLTPGDPITARITRRSSIVGEGYQLEATA